ncbi:MAG: sugar ABC transporter ATP-binding protein [Acidobacteriia bacterium]|nr:sugar ABC transporter ATP-binding protein [Terriglobia bacterium]
MLLSMRNIHKSFSGVPVLRDVCFDLNPGEVHILAGENGAGKTTLIKILAGVHTDYRGEIELNGRKERFTSPHDAARKGISVIHQETSLVGTLPAIDNIFLGRELTSRFSAGFLVDRKRQAARAKQLCALLGLDIELQRPVDDYPLSVRNRIEIAKALASNARILIMDEPTSALSDPEVERLFKIIAELKRGGSAIVYITHRMEEIYRVGDRITVLRDGRRIGTAPASELADVDLVRWMIGRELGTRFPSRPPTPGKERLRVEHFSVGRPGTSPPHGGRWLARDVSFALRSGEVLGIAGLQGSGNSALLAGLFGARPEAVKGNVYLDGSYFPVRSPEWSIRHGLAHLTSDRKGTGLILGLDVAKNISLASLRSISRWGVLQTKKEREMAERQVKSLAIRGASLAQEVQNLSGGNQQKVLLAKWIETQPRVLLLDEPTRGIDVGARQEIYALISRWTLEGIAIVLITSELQELIGLADRILVMHRGRISAEYSREQVTQEGILRAAMGDSWTN